MEMLQDVRAVLSLRCAFPLSFSQVSRMPEEVGRV